MADATVGQRGRVGRLDPRIRVPAGRRFDEAATLAARLAELSGGEWLSVTELPELADRIPTRPGRQGAGRHVVIMLDKSANMAVADSQPSEGTRAELVRRLLESAASRATTAPATDLPQALRRAFRQAGVEQAGLILLTDLHPQASASSRPMIGDLGDIPVYLVAVGSDPPATRPASMPAGK